MSIASTATAGMSTPKHTPSSSYDSSDRNGTATRFQSSNPFDALANADDAGNCVSRWSPSSSSEESTSQAVVNEPKEAPMTPEVPVTPSTGRSDRYQIPARRAPGSFAPLTPSRMRPAPQHDTLVNAIRAWSPFISVYTQDRDHPNGVVDMQYVRWVLEHTLHSMEHLVRVVCRRGLEWQTIVCDIGFPAKQVIVAFPDLLQRYEQLTEDARVAKAGGLPAGYDGL